MDLSTPIQGLRHLLVGRTFAFYVLASFVVIGASTLLLIVYRLFLHPLSRFPGPLPAKVTGLWRSKKYVDGNWHADVVELHEKYGRIVRIAPNELSIVDEHAMKNLYGHGHNARKTDWYSVWDPAGTAPQLFSELDKKQHAFLRKRLAGAYSMSSVLRYEKYIQVVLDLLLYRLKAKAEAGEVVDMAVWTNAFAFDTVGELGYGSQLGHLWTEKDVGGLRKTIFDAFFVLSNLGHFPGQARILQNPLMEKLQTFMGAPPTFSRFRDWTAEQIRKRLQTIETTKRDDLLTHFCRMKAADGGPAAFEAILIEAMNLIGAGADTTSIGMRACLHYLALNPEAYRETQRAVDKYYEDKSLDRPIKYNETQEIPYLVAVIKEATRIFPSIVFQLLRHAPKDFEVRGKSIPAGTPVGISPISQNRDKDIWGPDANEFRPERWLQGEARTKYLDTSSMTFGGNGPRMCIGRNIALVELHKFLAQFMRNFDFEYVDKSKPWRVTTYWFAYQHDQHMRITFRKNRSIREVTSMEAE
ncbi:cytochrome P450 [Exophiala viscosa]|uniref:Cytochrome P450 n=1 Tax=Exophiala viscosa TaxID=2486360 RepID=A0AAN6DUV6_9EURO|nr:cytochrome P450 [Exophiala viscosa]KAI1623915.1 cytochrome P450 [Exophiala viscosa]